MPTVIIGDVRTMAGPPAEAVAFEGSLITAVGRKDDVIAANQNADVIDLGERLVLPGFIDAHHHVSISALYAGGVRLDDTRSVEELLERLAAASAALAPGQWLVATEWDEGQLAERRVPTREELDDAVPDHPLFALHYTCHRAVANSRALDLAGIGPHTPDPAGGVIVRGRNAQPTGLLIERGMSRVETLARYDFSARDAAGFLDRLAAHYRALVEVGITRVADTAVPIDLLGPYRTLAERGDMLVPTIVCPVSTNGWLEEPWDLIDGDLASGQTFGPITIGPAKLVFDGAPGCAMCMGWGQAIGASLRTALLSVRTGSLDPIRTSLSVTPRLGTKIRSGITIYPRDAADRVIGALVERGFSVATHAIGNAAIEVATGAYEAAGAALHTGGIARIEHGSFLEPALIARLAGCGATIAVQPDMIRMPSYDSAVSIPGMPFFPLRRLIDAGVLVAGSSDYPVTGFDPLDGVRSAVRRATASGRILDPAERITVDEAFAVYTRNAATACHSADVTGTLEVGKRADLVVLDGSTNDLDSLRVSRTIIGGETVFASA